MSTKSEIVVCRASYRKVFSGSFRRRSFSTATPHYTHHHTEIKKLGPASVVFQCNSQVRFELIPREQHELEHFQPQSDLHFGTLCADTYPARLQLKTRMISDTYSFGGLELRRRTITNLPGAWLEFWTRILRSTVGLTLKPRIPAASVMACTRSTKLGWCERRTRKNNRLRRRTVRLFSSIAAIQT